MTEKRLFTSESVSEGHPGRIADQISDAVLGAVLKEDPNGRIACEAIVTTGMVFVFGEISTSAYVDIQSAVRQTTLGIGYNDPSLGFDSNNHAVMVDINEQSPDIAEGVNHSIETRDSKDSDILGKISAGDQGLMFGYAINETPELMPLPISLTHRLMRKVAELRKNHILNWLRPDNRARVTVEYDEDDQPKRVDTVVVSAQTDAEISDEEIKRAMIEDVIKVAVPEKLLDSDTRYSINPSGRFVIGDPKGDSGLTGRKIIVDAYGGYTRHGGGTFSGKNATEVDRSTSYTARYIAKNIVATGLTKKCEVQLVYTIGIAHLVSVRIDTGRTGKVANDVLVRAVRAVFDLRPAGIIEILNLRRPIYRQTTACGRFGRTDVDLPWERTDKTQALLGFIKEN